MLEFLGPFHTIAAMRGDGLLPEFARLLQARHADTAPIPHSNAVGTYSGEQKALRRLAQQDPEVTPSGGNVVTFQAVKAGFCRKLKKSSGS